MRFFGTPLGIVFTTVVVDLIGFGIVLPLLPLYAERYGASVVAIGFLTASYSLVQFVVAPLLGRLSDRYGRRPVILVALAGTAVASLVMGLANALWVLFAARIAQGAAGASYAVAQAYVADVTEPEKRAHGMGLIGAAFGIGFLLGPAIGALGALAGPRVPFFIAAALAGVNLLIAARRLPETRPAGVRPSLSRWDLARRAFADRAVAPLVWVSFAATVAFVGMESTFALFGERRMGFGLAETGLVFTYIGFLAAVVQGWLIRILTPRFGEVRLLQAGLVTTAAGLALLAPCTEVWQLLLAAIPLAVGAGLAFPSLTALVSRATGAHEQGGVLGVLASSSSLARVGGPLLATALFQHVSIASTYLVGAGLCVGCLGLVLGRALPRPEPSSAGARPG